MRRLRASVVVGLGLILSAGCADDGTDDGAGPSAPAVPGDGKQNGPETDVDCGGGGGPCADGKRCKTGADCGSGVCKETCQAPSPNDGAKNGYETDVDCGGAAPKCDDEKACTKPEDCKNGICHANVCKSVVCDDGIKNGTETDVDCGGVSCPKCVDLAGCLVAGDCTSSVCGDDQKCRVPSPTDLIKNGTETDVDCGGDAANPRCATDKTCLAHADCASAGCSYTAKCAARPSCTAHEGGDTCGFGGDGPDAASAEWESCCASAPAGAGGVLMNKYQVTAGRMRAFLGRVKGDVRKAVQDARAAGKLHGAIMDASWDLFLPTSMEGCDQKGDCGADEISDYYFDDPQQTPYQGIYTSAYRHVGGAIFNGENTGQQGCSVSSPGTHTYWMPADVQANYFGDSPAEHPQSVYDTKPINCVPYLVAQAFCIWDGGRLETQAEYVAAGGPVNGGATPNSPVPWGTPLPRAVGDNSDYTTRFPFLLEEDLAWANFGYSYEYPHLVNTDFVVYLSAPGRMRYRGENGHADLVGNIMEVTSDVNAASADPRTTLVRWTANGSWEGHPWGYYDWNFSLVEKYGKQGLRCVYPN